MFRLSFLSLLFSLMVVTAHWNGETGDSRQSSTSSVYSGPSTTLNKIIWIEPYLKDNGFTDATPFSIAYDTGVAVSMSAWGNTNTGADASNYVVGYNITTGKQLYNITNPLWNNLFNDDLLICETNTGNSITIIAVRDIYTKYIFSGIDTLTGQLVWSINTPLAAWIAGAGIGVPYQCNNGILVVSYEAGQGFSTPSIRTFDVSTGNSIANFTNIPLGGAVSIILDAEPTGTQAGIAIILVDLKDIIAVDLSTGTTLWSYTNRTTISPSSIIASPDNQLLLIWDDSDAMKALPDKLWLLNSTTGKIVNQFHFPKNALVMNFNNNWAWKASSNTSNPNYGTLVFGGSLTNDAQNQNEYGSIVAWDIVVNGDQIEAKLIANLDMTVGANGTIDPDGIIEYPNVGDRSVVMDANNYIYFTWLPTGYQWNKGADDDAPIVDKTPTALAVGEINNGNITITASSTPIMNGPTGSQLAFIPMNNHLFVWNFTHIYMLSE